jgi:membrane-bound serine protease (ClpP class)
MRYLWLILALSVLTTPALTQTVHVLTVDATINPAIAEYIDSGIQRASTEHASAIIIKLNTPGGLLKSTRVIVTSLLTAPLPVIVYVSPSGGQAASAGVFVTLAAHVAAMAPGTNIGAAHPVGMQGGEKDSIMNEKATNDAAAFIRSISEQRHRNVRWAEDAVRKSISVTETEALRDSIVDLVAPTVKALLDSLEGRTVIVNGTATTLRLRNAELIDNAMGTQQRILDLLSDPNVAYIFFLLGIYGLFFELYNPGAVLPGVVGVISIIIALYSLHTLPVNYAGLALMIFGIILFILEIKIVSHGVLALGGIVSLTLGSIMLINASSALEMVSISWKVIAAAVITTSAFFLFAIGMGIRAQQRKPVTGSEGLVGLEGIATTALNPDGSVLVRGEYWNASAQGGTIAKDSRIVVTRVNGLRLIVAAAVEQS